jgi:hypothetical protein
MRRGTARQISLNNGLLYSPPKTKKSSWERWRKTTWLMWPIASKCWDPTTRCNWKSSTTFNSILMDGSSNLTSKWRSSINNHLDPWTGSSIEIFCGSCRRIPSKILSNIGEWASANLYLMSAYLKFHQFLKS